MLKLEIGQLLQHRYGGFYTFEGLALDTATATDVVVYRHVWPFEAKLFTRPVEEFMDGRFSIKTEQDLMATKAEYLAEEFSLVIANHKKNKSSIWS